jgi:hypothetical protein
MCTRACVDARAHGDHSTRHTRAAKRPLIARCREPGAQLAGVHQREVTRAGIPMVQILTFWKLTTVHIYLFHYQHWKHTHCPFCERTAVLVLFGPLGCELRAHCTCAHANFMDALSYRPHARCGARARGPETGVPPWRRTGRAATVVTYAKQQQPHQLVAVDPAGTVRCVRRARVRARSRPHPHRRCILRLPGEPWGPLALLQAGYATRGPLHHARCAARQAARPRPHPHHVSGLPSPRLPPPRGTQAARPAMGPSGRRCPSFWQPALRLARPTFTKSSPRASGSRSARRSPGQR